MNTKLTAKIKTFASEIKEKSGSFFSENLTYPQFEGIIKKYNSALRLKRGSVFWAQNDDYYSFTAKNEKTGLLERYMLRPSHELTNEQILKIIICVDVFYLSYQAIKAIVKN